MLYPVIDPKKWAAMYDLTIVDVECRKCKNKFTLDQPVAVDEFRGLQAKLHECGPNYQTVVFKSVDPKTAKMWNKLDSMLKG